MTGSALRTSALLNHSLPGSVIVAFDHGVAGVPPGGQNTFAMLNDLATPELDAVLLGPGLARQFAPMLSFAGAPRLVVAIDGGSFGPVPAGMGEPLSNHRLFLSPSGALRLGATAAKMLLPVGLGSADALADSMALVARAAEDCDEIGLPLMVEPAFWGKDISTVTDEMIAHTARMAIELGATILKLPAPADLTVLAQIVDGTPVPVYVLGGAPVEGTGIAQAIVEWINAGAIGVVIGRSAWTRRDLHAAIAGLSAAVHERDAELAELHFQRAD